MATWWFVRHGESLAQLNQWSGHDQETPLSPLGEQQADSLAEPVATLPIQRVLVSPYLRARQTATRATRLLDHPHQQVHDLRERLMGDEYRLRYHGPEINRNLATWDFRPPGGESVLDAATRAVRCLASLENGDNTIIFAHGRILAGVLTLLDELDPAAGVYPVDNCVLVERTIDQGRWVELLASF
ncbi:MAG: histidine phosphatase family protein [Planctomycetes bacterium]|nr:histidine phosphatase family protein [Planctomycetota bacterium]